MCKLALMDLFSANIPFPHFDNPGGWIVNYSVTLQGYPVFCFWQTVTETSPTKEQNKKP